MIKITGGIYRGTKINVAIEKDLRPTVSFLREWLFNILNNVVNIEDLNVLDCFAGSGIIGLEFLSRNAQFVTFVEKNYKIYKQLNSNISKLAIPHNKYQILRMDFNHFLAKSLKKEQFKFNTIYLDPPFRLDILNDIGKTLNELRNLQKENIIIIIECPKNYKMTSLLNFKLINTKRYGDSSLSIYQI